MVIRKLDLKLLRDVRFSPWLFLGIVLLVMSGITLFDASYISYNSLAASYQLTYQKLNMADFTVDLQSAPQDVVKRIQRIPGVKQVDGRVTEDLTVEQRLATKRVIGRIISIPDAGLPSINTLHIVNGTLPGRGNKRELLLENSFAKFNGYKPGDFIYPIVGDDEVRYRVSGIVMSPEYMWVVASTDDPMPQPKQFGVMFMRKEMADRLFGTDGSVNQVAVTIMPGANRSRIMRQAADILSPYGADDPIPMQKQAGYEVLQRDLRGFRTLATLFPMLFLAIAALSIYNLLGRMIYSQRAQIGFMRSVGYGRRAVLRHYILFAALTGLLGSAIGTVLGYYLAFEITGFYATIVSIPFTEVTPRWGIMAAGIGISLLTAVLAGLVPSLSASRMTPAEAIRTEAPSVGRAPAIENLIPRLKKASFVWRLPMRNLLRAPKRTFSTIMGIASAITLIMVSAGLMDSGKAMINFYFDRMLRYDAMVTFIHPQSQGDLGRIRTWKGVQRVEPLLQVPVKLVHNGREMVTSISGIESNTQLLALSAYDGTRISVPRTGIATGGDLMKRLGLCLGQKVILTVPHRIISDAASIPVSDAEVNGSRIGKYRDQVFSLSRGIQDITFKKQVVVTTQTYEPIGNRLVMSIHELRRLFGQEFDLPPNAISAIMVKVAPGYVKEVSRDLYNLTGAASVVDVQDMRQQIDQAMSVSNAFESVMFGFAIALAFIVIFNSTMLNILERTREIASLRALGVTRLQISSMLTIENLCTWLAGTVIGLPVGRLLAHGFVSQYNSETFHFRSAVFPRTYVMTVTTIFLTVLVSQIPGILRLFNLNLAKATKELSE